MPTFDLAETLVGVFQNTATWDSWEMHPAGDEIVCLLSGSLDVVLDEDGAERNIELRRPRGPDTPASRRPAADGPPAGR